MKNRNERKIPGPAKTYKLSSIGYLCLGLSVPLMGAQASIVSGEIGYQQYLDFGKNRGAFQVGQSNIDIMGTDGSIKGTITVPMPDFSVADTSGVATLVAPQYITSVKHNTGYTGVSFGDSSNWYSIVDRNLNSSVDLHAPRLNKVVTEIAPVAYVDGLTSALAKNANYLRNSDRYTAFFRTGSGTQLYRHNGNNIWVNGAYGFLTGGTVKNLSSYWSGTYLTTNSTWLTIDNNGLLPNQPQAGDSGSPLLAYDSWQKQWVIVGVTSSISANGTNWTVVDSTFLDKTIADDTDPAVTVSAQNGSMIWAFDAQTGQGTLTQAGQTSEMHGVATGGSLADGKNLAFNGSGTLELINSIQQGAGALTFDGQYVVTTQNGSTWQGGGLILNQGANVAWQVNGVKGDNLHVVGAGTLTQQGVGVNEGGLKVGYGTTVILDQRADAQGHTQAFSSINLNSGSSKVILTSAGQVDPDTIMWGYRGGTLDVNGNDLTFHKLTHSDSGAILANENTSKRATIALQYYTTPDQIAIKKWENSKKGTVGDVYCGDGGGCWVLKTSSYGYFPNTGESNANWQWAGWNQEGQANGQMIGAGYRNNLMFHGQFKGNLNVTNVLPTTVTQPMVVDGSIDISGDFTQTNGRLTFQGHPVIHAYVAQWQSDGLANVGDTGIFTTPTTFDQSDWETRTFAMNRLKLTNTDFGLGRNAILYTAIEAKGSQVTLGDERLFTDLNDGNGTTHTLNQGRSNTTTDNDLAQFVGSIVATDQSVVTLNGKVAGDLTATDSDVVLNSKYLNLDHVKLQNSTLSMNGNTILRVNQLWQSDIDVDINSSQVILQNALAGSTQDEVAQSLKSTKEAVTQASATKAGYYEAPTWKLSGPTSTLEVGLYGVVNGDITMDNKNTLSFTGEGSLLTPTTEAESQAIRRLNGFGHAWRGSINGDWGTATLDNTLWLMTKSSNIETLTLTNSMISWRNVNDTTNPWALLDTQNTANDGLTSLTVKNLTLNNSGLILRTRGQESDRLTVTGDLKGANNQLYVNYVTPSDLATLNTPLITVKGSMDKDAFKAGTLSIGFTHVTPIFEVKQDDNGQNSQIILTGFNTQADYQATRQAQDVLNLSYQGFVSEVNNMNLRMGELRDNSLNSGTWVRLTQAGGSTDTSDNDWFGVQTGADRQIRFASGSTYLGALLTYTHGQSSGDSFSSQGDSYGLGVYASTVLDSGLYVDAIAKYVRTKNDYTFAIGGQQAAQLGQNLFYAGAEVGYRYQVSASSFVEPQGELVLGYLSAQDFAWQNADSTGRMHQDASTPLYGRMGVVYGKHFEGQNWKLDARIGGHYEFDLTSMGDMLLQDQANSQTVDAGRDGRFVYSLGVNAEVGKNTRIGVELQRSAFGRYNLDHLVNANVRYSF